MLPEVSLKWGRAGMVVHTQLNMLLSKTVLKTEGSKSAILPRIDTPTLLTSISIFLNRPIVSLINNCPPSMVETSQQTRMTSGCIFNNSVSVFFSLFSSRPLITIEAPNLANAVAMAFPMPLLDPVIMATLPDNLVEFLSGICVVDIRVKFQCGEAIGQSHHKMYYKCDPYCAR